MNRKKKKGSLPCLLFFFIEFDGMRAFLDDFTCLRLVYSSFSCLNLPPFSSNYCYDYHLSVRSMPQQTFLVYFCSELFL